MAVHSVRTGVDLLALDHIALSVADPEAMAAFLCDHVGMDTLARDAEGAVVGAGAGAGAGAATIALIGAEGPRESGPLARLVLRVADVERAVASLPAGTAVEGDRIEDAMFEGPEGLRLGFTLVAGGGIDYDLDHVVLGCSDPEQTWVALVQAGFATRGGALHVADKYIALRQSSEQTHRPLLDHIGVRVESIEMVVAKMRALGLEVDEHVADDTCAVVLPGPDPIALHVVQRTVYR